MHFVADFRCVWFMKCFHCTILKPSDLWNESSHTVSSFNQTNPAQNCIAKTHRFQSTQWALEFKHGIIFAVQQHENSQRIAMQGNSAYGMCNKVERTLLRLGTGYETLTQCYDTRGYKLLFTVCLFSSMTQMSFKLTTNFVRGWQLTVSSPGECLFLCVLLLLQRARRWQHNTKWRELKWSSLDTFSISSQSSIDKAGEPWSLKLCLLIPFPSHLLIKTLPLSVNSQLNEHVLWHLF